MTTTKILRYVLQYTKSKKWGKISPWLLKRIINMNVLIKYNFIFTLQMLCIMICKIPFALAGRKINIKSVKNHIFFSNMCANRMCTYTVT